MKQNDKHVTQEEQKIQSSKIKAQKAQANSSSWVINISGFVLFILSFATFSSNSFSLLFFLASLLLPLALLAIYRYFDGYLAFTIGRNKGRYPTIFLGFGLVILSSMSNLFHPHFGGNRQLLFIVLPLGVAALLGLVKLSSLNSIKSNTTLHIAIAGILPSFAYAYILFVFLNCYCDYHRSDIYRPIVTAKYLAEGRNGRRDPHIIIEGDKDLSVSFAEYDIAIEGSPITIKKHSGALNIAWFEIEP
jgi:uncharacterized integral membrane protein